MTTLTKSTGTVTLSGAVEKVTLPAAYGWVWVKNMSDADMVAGLSADISEGADGVMVIPSGECGRIQTDGFNSFYLLGTGNALVVAQNYADCPFKVGGKGGEIPDLSAYAKKTDVPTQVSQLENDSGYLTKHPVVMPDAGKTLGKLLQFGDTFSCMTDVRKDGNGHIIAIYNQLNTLPNIPTEYAKKTDIPTELPANGGTADTARQVVSSKIKLYEDNEGGNLRLVSPDGVHFMEMDIYNNEQFRMYFDGGDGIVYPLTYNFITKKISINGDADTVDGKHASDFALKPEIPTSLPANGGNADTLDGKHADDFLQLADEIILNNIRINANQHKIADINYRWSIWADDEGGNLQIKSPDDSREIQFDCFDNNIFRIYTYVNGEYFGIIEMNHSTGEVTSNGNVISKKPYISGSATVAANSDVCVTNHGFMPSAVIWWDGNDSGVAISFSETQFTIEWLSGVDRTINYLIFK